MYVMTNVRHLDITMFSVTPSVQNLDHFYLGFIINRHQNVTICMVVYPSCC